MNALETDGTGATVKVDIRLMRQTACSQVDAKHWTA